MQIKTGKDLEKARETYRQMEGSYAHRVLVCGGAGCTSARCEAVRERLELAVVARGLENQVQVQVTGCMGICSLGPNLLVEPEGIFYPRMTPERIDDIVVRHLVGGEVAEEYCYYDPVEERRVPRLEDIDWYRRQVRVALRNCGRMDRGALQAYIARDGYQAFAAALEGEPEVVREEIVETLKQSGLRGPDRGGFPTGLQWETAMLERDRGGPGGRWVVCNVDEGDPGAFVSRSILEGDPHSVIEGLLLCGLAVGADRGVVYVRTGYPLVTGYLEQAIAQARQAGLLGEDILGSGFGFQLELRTGYPLLACGEDMAPKAAALENGEFPIPHGDFWEGAAVVSSVETLAKVPPILQNGGEWYRRHGTAQSPGTKAFSLTGDLVHTGVVEVPMGIPLGDVVHKVGGGLRSGRTLKAVQLGGAFGGCLTKQHLNVGVDYESLARESAVMGSGGLTVLSEDNCMVSAAHGFLDFMLRENCARCPLYRSEMGEMLGILDRIIVGEGVEEDLETLESLSQTISSKAVCRLGQAVIGPVRSTVRWFRHEYESHIRENHCMAGACTELQTSPCRNACPVRVYVPGYLALVSAGRLRDAYALIRRDNPFPAVCGRVCTHPCELQCVRREVDEAVCIRDVKRYVGDWALNSGLELPMIRPLPATGKRVAVIGSGPSGLTCAYYLANLGHEVVVYEAERVAGGVLYWGIPEFRLPHQVLAREIEEIQRAGVRIQLNTYVGRDLSFDVLRERHDAVFIAVGTQKSRKLDIPGEELEGVESGLEFLRRVGLHVNRRVERRVLVVGGGSTAFDCARTALRLGAGEVTLVYRRTPSQMTATREEIDEAVEEGVQVVTLASPVEILGEGGRVRGVRLVRREMTDYGPDGRQRSAPIDGDEFQVACEQVIAAINQDVDRRFYQTQPFAVTGDQQPAGDPFTTKVASVGGAGVFVGGDAAPWGANVVVDAISDGKRAARNIDRFLGGSGKLNKGLRPEEIPVVEDDDGEVEPHEHFETRHLAPDKRQGNFDEVALGYRRLDAMAESLRCLRCDRKRRT